MARASAVRYNGGVPLFMKNKKKFYVINIIWDIGIIAALKKFEWLH